MKPRNASETTWIVNFSTWDDGDQVVTIRPDWEKPWKDVPVGKLLSRAQAATVADWLRSALPDIMKICENMLSPQN